MEEKYNMLSNNKEFTNDSCNGYDHDFVRKSLPSLLAGNMEHYSTLLLDAAKVIREQEEQIDYLRKQKKLDDDVNNMILDQAFESQTLGQRYYFMKLVTPEQLLTWYLLNSDQKDEFIDKIISDMDE